MITHLIIFITSAIISGVIVHFLWSRYHTDIKHGLQVAIDGANAEIARLRNKIP